MNTRRPALILSFTLAVALVGPALNAAMPSVAGDRQGTLMGLSSAAGSLGKVAGPLWAGYLYELHIEYPYLSGAGALLIGLLVGIAGMRAIRAASPAQPPAKRHIPG